MFTELHVIPQEYGETTQSLYYPKHLILQPFLLSFLFRLLFAVTDIHYLIQQQLKNLPLSILHKCLQITALALDGFPVWQDNNKPFEPVFLGSYLDKRQDKANN